MKPLLIALVMLPLLAAGCQTTMTPPQPATSATPVPAATAPSNVNPASVTPSSAVDHLLQQSTDEQTQATSGDDTDLTNSDTTELNNLGSVTDGS